ARPIRQVTQHSPRLAAYRESAKVRAHVGSVGALNLDGQLGQPTSHRLPTQAQPGGFRDKDGQGSLGTNAELLPAYLVFVGRGEEHHAPGLDALIFSLRQVDLL